MRQTCPLAGRTVLLTPLGSSTGDLLQIYRTSQRGARVWDLLLPEKTVYKAYINAQRFTDTFTADIRTASKCADVPQFPSPWSPKRCSTATGLLTGPPPQIKGYSTSNLFGWIPFRISFCNAFTTLPQAQCGFPARKTQQWSAGKKLSHDADIGKCRYQDVVWQKDFVLGFFL